MKVCVFKVMICEGMMPHEVNVVFDVGGKRFNTCMSDRMVHRIDEEGDWSPWTGEDKPSYESSGQEAWAEIGAIRVTEGGVARFSYWFGHQLDGVSPEIPVGEINRNSKIVDLPYR